MVHRLVILTCLLVGCGSTADSSASGVDTADGLFPEVVDVSVDSAPSGAFDFSVTLSSPYDTPDRYADAWRVRSEDGQVFGVRELAHDHANEQPFTRTLNSVLIPESVTEVVVEGRDQVNGWGGPTFTVPLPGR